MAKPKSSIELEHRTLQVHPALYQVIHQRAVDKQVKIYEMVNKLLLLGLQEWSKTQIAKLKVNINRPSLAQARKMAEVVS